MSCGLVSDGIITTPRIFCCQESTFGTSSRHSVLVSVETHLQKPALKASATLLLPYAVSKHASLPALGHSFLLRGCPHASSGSSPSALYSVSLDVFHMPGLRSAAFRQIFAPDGSVFLNHPLPNSARFRTFSVRGDEFTALASDATFYDLLGISENVSFSEIKQAYKQMALRYHPDVSPPDQTEEYTKRFIRVQQAYETLSDARKREIYDRDLARRLHYAFSTRKHFDQELEEKTVWRNRWQDQVAGLKRRSMYRASEGNQSWGARMRRMRRESSEE